jgi:hypothetical protein
VRRRWRRQHCEFPRPRRQEEQWRPRRRRVARADEHHHRLIEEAELRGRRWRHTKVIVGESRRRFERLPQLRQAPARIPVVRATRIAAHVGPISRRRIGHYGAAPNDLLAANRQHAGDAAGIRRVRIDGEELLIAVDGVAIDRPRIGVLDIAEITD